MTKFISGLQCSLGGCHDPSSPCGCEGGDSRLITRQFRVHVELCALNRVLTFKLSLQRFVKHLRASSNNLAPARLKTKWRAAHRYVAVGDVVWLADQSALRGQCRLARVVNVSADKEGDCKGCARENRPQLPSIGRETLPGREKPATKVPATILHRDIRRIVVLLPGEEQQNGQLQDN